ARRMIGQYLIDMVDEAGYLSGDLQTVAAKLGAPLAEVEAVLAVLQGFDPPMQGLVRNLPLLANRQFAALKNVCGVGDEDLADMVGEIRKLNPKPGLAFGTTPVQPIVPDVFVRLGPDGGWIVELNSETLPKVLVNQNYYAK